MAYVNPGYAAAQALQAYVLDKQTRERQDMLDNLKLQQEQLKMQEHQQQVQQQQEDRQRKMVDDKVSTLVPGDVPSSDLVQEYQRVTGMKLPTKIQADPASDEQGPMPGGADPLGTERVYLGSPQYRMQQMAAQQKAADSQAQAESLANVASGDDPRAIFQAALAQGRSPAEAKIIAEQAAGQSGDMQPIVRINPRTGKIETLGEAPKGAHFVNTPAPVNVNVGQGGMDNLSDGALTFMAEQRLAGGPEPAFGSGTQGAIARQKFATKLAELAAARGLTGADLARLTAQYKADTGSLAAITKSSDAVKAFMDAADRNAGPGGIETLLGKIPDSGFAVVNKIWRPIAGNMSDQAQTDMKAFQAYINSLKNEYARITSQPNLAGQLTDSARHEMEVIINDSSTVPQIKGALMALRNEGVNRERSLDDRTSDILGRIGAGGNGAGAPAGGKKKTAEELIRQYGGSGKTP